MMAFTEIQKKYIHSDNLFDLVYLTLNLILKNLTKEIASIQSIEIFIFFKLLFSGSKILPVNIRGKNNYFNLVNKQLIEYIASLSPD